MRQRPIPCHGPSRHYTGDFTTGDVVDPRHKCLMPFGGGTGENVSPMLEWSGGPTDTESFAVVLYDTTYNMLHWVIWDILRVSRQKLARCPR